jgi:peptide/nickel transport system permease protein
MGELFGRQLARGAFAGTLNRLRSCSPGTHVALGLLAVYFLVALFGEFLAPASPTDMNLNALLQPPSAKYFFGTDNYGRDIFSRVLFGTRYILVLSITSAGLGVLAGMAVGMPSGFAGGSVDQVIMRVLDVFMALPGLLLALLMMTSLGASKLNLVAAVVVTFVPKSARVARSATLVVKGQGFVDVARLRGERMGSILLFEVLPNIREIMIVEFCIRFGYSILLIASLGFIGLGVQPPTPDWGLMIYEGRDFVMIAPWIVAFPALAIGTLVISVNQMADGVWGAHRTSRIPLL